MNKKTIYWAVGIIAVIGTGIYGYKKGWFGENESNVQGGCSKPTYDAPSSNFCTQWKWNTKTCKWVCETSVKPPKDGGALLK